MAEYIIETNQGAICGKSVSVKPELSDKKCVNFNRIPFGTYERFERAEAFGTWDGTWDGKGITPMQPQYNILYDEKQYDKAAGICMFPENGKELFAEIPTVDGTLYLSVYTPENFQASDKKPVMVWIHGGGWTCGGTNEYNGAPLSIFGDVVVVLITYRLNVLGFTFGNYGLWDQLEALKWVQSNISAYGGDKDNVTIFGESAGGWSVEALLSSEKTVGYFHKAIAQSGCLKCVYMENAQLRTACLDFARKYFNVETDEQLKSTLMTKSVTELVTFYKAVPMLIASGFTAHTTTDDFFQQPMKDQNSFPNKVPFMSGMNSTECGCLMAVMGEEMTPGLDNGWTKEQMTNNYKQMALAMGTDPSATEGFIKSLTNLYSNGRDMTGQYEYSRLHCKYTSDLVFLGCLHRLEAICNDQSVFHYEINVQTKAFHEEPYKNGATLIRKDFCRTDHADDLMYVFGFMFDPLFKLPEGRYFAEDEKDVSKRIMKAWSSFARTGNPGWKAFVPSTKEMVEFNTPTDLVRSANDSHVQARLTLWRQLNGIHYGS